METEHDTFAELDRGTPRWFAVAARTLPLGILLQFLSAGASLSGNSGLWGLHASFGGVLVLPAAALLVGALVIARLRGFGWWAGLVVLLYLIQVALAAVATPALLSLHPFNGALLLVASLVLAAKVERRAAMCRRRQSA
ncbi:hypothetical protein SAMN05428997_101429 [Bosea sp. CRIB-10]|uniref:DUF6220 domain-containing protein n=1 Tax=Bosea sp. CRIB-10 TaxID=378404 RepID=UPI0008E78456|nr:DUF6220 domain-containing protein [Bosea sp. CRIB-10]SFB71564.1 hypothetical protein SAMN05428997_101429 [Bosea sp. CRIB-10]